jgi:2-dehydropantoate 2-reductase
MRYAVVGLGAVGSLLGGLLAKTGDNITLIGKKNQVDVIKKNGITIDGVHIIENLHVADKFSSLTDVDVVFVCVKSYDTIELALKIKKYLKKSALIVSMQNGVGNARQLEGITGVKTLSSVVLFNAIYKRAGNVTLTMKGGLLLENNKEIHKVLKKAGFKVEIIYDIYTALWSKLVLNLQIAVTALTGQSIKESIKDRVSRKIIISTMNEGLWIVKRSEIRLKALPKVDPRKMIWILKTGGFLSNMLSSHIIGLKENARNSMWQSLSRCKPTEIDYINGEIVNLAKQNNLKAPINTKLVELIKEAERKHLTKSFEPNELKKILKI